MDKYLEYKTRYILSKNQIGGNYDIKDNSKSIDRGLNSRDSYKFILNITNDELKNNPTFTGYCSITLCKNHFDTYFNEYCYENIQVNWHIYDRKTKSINTVEITEYKKNNNIKFIKEATQYIETFFNIKEKEDQLRSLYHTKQLN